MRCLEGFLATFDDQFFLVDGNEVLEMNSRRFKGFRVSIIMAHEKFPTFAFGTRLYFLFLDFWKCQCTLLGPLTCELDFIIINKNDHFIQIVY